MCVCVCVCVCVLCVCVCVCVWGVAEGGFDSFSKNNAVSAKIPVVKSSTSLAYCIQRKMRVPHLNNNRIKSTYEIHTLSAHNNKIYIT